MVAQIEKTQHLQDQLTSVQFQQQANGALSVGGLIPGQIPASISTGITQESMEVMFKHDLQLSLQQVRPWQE